MELKNKYLLSNKILAGIAEYGAYLLAVFLFTDKGESFRSIGLYIPPIALILKAYLAGRWPFDWKNPLFLSIALFCLSAVVSAIFLHDPSFAVLKIYLKFFLIFWIASATLDDTSLLRRMLLLLSMLSVFFTVTAFYDFMTKAVSGNGQIIYDNVRKYNPILAYLLPFVPFALLSAGNTARKILWSLIISTGITALLLTGFRGGWISFSTSILVWGVWFSIKRMSKVFLSTLIGILIAVLIVLTVVPSSHITRRFNEGFSTTGRYEWRWKAYLQIYSAFPPVNKIIGKGLLKETMFESYNKWYKQKTGEYPAKDFQRNPHNSYLNILFKQGMLGLLLYINLIIINLMFLINAVKRQGVFLHKAMGIALLCPLIGEYAVRGLVEDTRFLPLGFILGIIAAYIKISTDYNDNRISCPGTAP